MSEDTKTVTNLKGMYFEKDMGDGTSIAIVRTRRPDDQVFALAMKFRFGGGKMLTCFLEDAEGVSFVDEMSNALVDYLEDLSQIEIEKMEEAGEAFTLRKEEAKNDKKQGDVT